MMSERDNPVVETPDFVLAALERTSDAVVIVDGVSHVSFFNAAAERIWGLDRADVLGRDVGALGLKALQAPDEDPRKPGHSEISIVRADGRRLRAAQAVSSVEIGGQNRRIAFFRDITSERELRERLALHEVIADGTNRAVMITDRNLKIIYANATFAGMFGHTIEQAQGRQAIELLAGPHTDRQALKKLLRLTAVENAYDRNGDEIWVSARVKAFRNARGRVKYMLALLSDITETKQLWSLQQLIMNALADEIPIAEIADRLCRRVEEIAPDVVSSLLHVDAGG
jgi:PAS domain S-box-containing protein